jgi:hypothetical protein
MCIADRLARLRLAAKVAPAVLILLAGCGTGAAPGSPPAGAGNGIEGIALAGPQCPVEVAGSPCPPRPIAARVVVSDRTGAEITSFRTGVDGRFRVALAPGRYTLQALDQAPLLLKPTEVTVPAGQFAWVQLNFDTGIR